MFTLETPRETNEMQGLDGANVGTVSKNIAYQPGNGRVLKLNSFFSGIGGFDLAFARAGVHPIFQCEKDPYCRSVLERHWRDMPHSSDITKLDAKSIPFAHIWSAGFPCQDVSVARGWLGR